MIGRAAIGLALALALVGRANAQQAQVTTAPAPGQAAQPAPAANAQPAAPPSTPAPLLPAGVVPSRLTLSVSGSPADATFLDTQIRDALDRQIRPTLRPGASIGYGPIVPWPLVPLAAGGLAAVNVTVTIGGGESATVTGVTTVDISNTVVQSAAPSVLFLSDDPEHIATEGLIFAGSVDASRQARLYYYHDDIGLPRDIDVVLTATAHARVHVIQSEARPDLDVMSVGHTVSRDLLLYQLQNEGIVVDVAPGEPVVLRHDLLLAGELVAGAIDLHVLFGGPLKVSVIATPAGGNPLAYLAGPRMSLDGHNRHGTFDLDGFGVIKAAYTIGGPDAAVKYGVRSVSPRNVDTADPGRDYGDYGVVHRIVFDMVNPTDASHPVYLYEKPLGGPVRSTFVVDGQLKELGCARVAQPYWLMTYLVPPHTTGQSTTLTMTDGGSNYPLEFGMTESLPLPNTPPPNAVDGCSARPTPVPTAVATAPPTVPGSY